MRRLPSIDEAAMRGAGTRSAGQGTNALALFGLVLAGCMLTLGGDSKPREVRGPEGGTQGGGDSALVDAGVDARDVSGDQALRTDDAVDEAPRDEAAVDDVPGLLEAGDVSLDQGPADGEAGTVDGDMRDAVDAGDGLDAADDALDAGDGLDASDAGGDTGLDAGDASGDTELDVREAGGDVGLDVPVADVGCASGLVSCFGRCVNPLDPLNCGRSCIACPSGPNGLATCNGTSCGFACNPGYSDCDHDVSNGCERPRDTCDECVFSSMCVDARRANTTAACVAGSCRYDCVAGFDDCDRLAANGCEANLSDAMSCGACGVICPPTQVCNAGRCQLACTPDLTACGAAAGMRCVNLREDAYNCGACGNVCPGNKTCMNGECRCPALTPYFCGGMCEGPLAARTHCNSCVTDPCEGALLSGALTNCNATRGRCCVGTSNTLCL